MFIKKGIIKILVVSICIMAQGSFQESEACSAFSFKSKGKVIVAKNYDWFFNHGHGAVLITPRNTSRIAFNPNLKEQDPFQWESRFGSVTFTQFGKGFPASGFNEKGLVIEILELDQAVYNGSESNHGGEFKRGINEAQWAQYQLDQFESTAEVLEHLEERPVNKAYIGVHYFITDASGESAVVEFLDGRVVSYSGDGLKTPALTNSPYEELVKYQTSHPNETCPSSIWFWRTSENRFCTMSSLLKQEFLGSELDAATQILDAVRMNGSSYDAAVSPTQWMLVHNITDRKITFKTRGEEHLKWIDLNKIDFESLNQIQVFDMDSKEHGDITERFVPYSSDFNASLIYKNYYLLWANWMRGWGWIDVDTAIQHGESEK
jgi:choloylglycine hydrolase